MCHITCNIINVFRMTILKVLNKHAAQTTLSMRIMYNFTLL